MANVALVTFGSAGDVHPMLAIGRALQARGHRVAVLTNPAAGAAVTQAGLELVAIGSLEDHDATVRHPKLWHPVDGLGVLWRYLLRPALRPTYEALERMQRQERWVVVASPVAMGARVAQEALGLPLITAYTAATMLRTTRAPMTLAAWRVPALVPEAVLRMAWRTLDRFKLEPLVGPALRELRASLGLKPLAQSVFGEWMHSPLAGVALFPDWFAAAAGDWPAQVRQAGFALYDGDGALPPSLQAFLAEGGKPVVFMPGTAAQSPAAFHEAAIAACRQSGRRGVLLGNVDPALRASLPPTLHALPYAPFSQLLPHAAALVHHGGVGSCAQALRAGIPQVIVPQGYDQFDNAMRIERLGAGASLPRARLDRLGAQLRALLAQRALADRCRGLAEGMAGTAAPLQVAALVEQHA